MTEQHSHKAEKFTELILQIFRVNGKLVVEGDRLVAPFDQTSSRWRVLGAIEAEPTSVPVIGRTMGISRQSVQRTADILTNEGLCQFISNPHHQKSPLLKLTPQGEKILKKIGEIQINWANRIAESLKEKDIETAAMLLKQLEQLLGTQD